MDQLSVESCLADLNLPAIRYFDRIDSTNDEARRWIEAGAPSCALVIADEQTAGRGRLQRRWLSPPGACLAFSLVLLPPLITPHSLSRLTGLGALAVHKALRNCYALPAQIKWPNDVLVNQRKLAGVLVEAFWSGTILKAVIVGIGINIAPESVSEVNLPTAEVNYPPTCLENELGRPVDRLEILRAVLFELLDTLPRLPQPSFIIEWEDNLAFRNQWVELSSSSADKLVGKVVGLEQDGSLILATSSGKLITAAVGDLHLRPVLADQSSRPQE